MDFAKLSINDLRKLRDTYRENVASLKKELQIVEKAVNNSDNESDVEIVETKHSDNEETDEDRLKTQELLQMVTNIKSMDVAAKPIKNEGDSELYLYTCNGKFDKLHFKIEYESNIPFDDAPLSDIEENITKLNIKILRPNLQAKIQKGIDFFQQYPNNFGGLYLFLKSLNNLIEIRSNVVKNLYEFEQNLNIGISKSTDQHNFIFKNQFDSDGYLHIKWNFKWEMRTGMARDVFTAKILRADDQLMGELKMLVEKLCSDKFANEATPTEKETHFRNIVIAVKDADFRNRSTSPTPTPDVPS